MAPIRSIIINLDDEHEKRFDDLKRRSKSKNDHHVIAKALATYDFLIDQKSHESIILIKSAKGKKEFRIS